MSQNKSKPLKNPVMPKDKGAFLWPNFDKNHFAMIDAAPVFSSMIAINDPEIIRKPIFPIVFPNPSFINGKTSANGIVARAKRRDTKNRTIKA